MRKDDLLWLQAKVFIKGGKGKKTDIVFFLLKWLLPYGNIWQHINLYIGHLKGKNTAPIVQEVYQ